MKSINIRKAELGDIENLVVLKQQVWIATYAVERIRTELSSYVFSAFTPQNIRRTLLDSNCLILLAELNNHIVGCIEIKLCTENTIEEVKNFPEIAVLYVLERFCGMGVGQVLMNEACCILQLMGYASAWLSVLYSNERALNFYSKNGFKDIGSIYFEMNGNKYENRVLLKEL